MAGILYISTDYFLYTMGKRIVQTNGPNSTAISSLLDVAGRQNC